MTTMPTAPLIPILDELSKLSPELVTICQRVDAGAQLLRRLPELYKPNDVASAPGNRGWELCGLYLFQVARFHDALSVFFSLYGHMLDAQTASGSRVHKGMPLVWISDCFLMLGYVVHAKRYLMLSLCEDALTTSGDILPEVHGVYFRLVHRHGLPHVELERFANEFYEYGKAHTEECLFPEAVLQQVGDSWLSESPAIAELSVYHGNTRYIDFLLRKLGVGGGEPLELLAEYVLSCIAGCRTKRHVLTRSTDLDIICAMEGPAVDFRREFGGYFVCECKDWGEAADFTTMAKFCRVLDSVKARFGILFSNKDISGKGRLQYASLEQLKVFQDRGIVIIVLNREHLKSVGSGRSLIEILRSQYDSVRLDIKPES
jgi:hypothetical protein